YARLRKSRFLCINPEPAGYRIKPREPTCRCANPGGAIGGDRGGFSFFGWQPVFGGPNGWLGLAALVDAHQPVVSADQDPAGSLPPDGPHDVIADAVGFSP